MRQRVWPYYLRALGVAFLALLIPATMNFRFPNFSHSLLLFVPVVLAVSLMQDWPFTILVALTLGIALDSFSYRFPLFYTICLPLTLFLRAVVPERDLEHNRTIAALTTLVVVIFIAVCQLVLASFSGARTLSTLPFKVNVFGIIACTLLTFLTWRTVLRWFGVTEGRYGR